MLKKLEGYGVIVIFMLFCALHFLYSSTGASIFMPFSAINESVFEHLKIGFFAGLFYAIFEYFMGVKENNNFIFAKLLALIAIPIFITVVFYGYTSIVGKSILFIDIFTAFLSGCVSQWISYKILSSKKDYSKYNLSFSIVLIGLVLAFSLFTFFPPKLGIFTPSSK